MKKFAIRFLTFISIFILSITSCKKEAPIDNPGGNSNGLTFEEVIAVGGNIDDPTISSSVDTSDVQSNLPIGDGTFNCTTVTYSVDAAGGGDSGFPLFNPNADVIYPGSMLQGNSLNQATPNPIVVERAGGTISTDILDGNLQSSFEVAEVKKSTITDGINNILSTATGSLPANFNIKIEEIQSREQFALELGVDVNTAFLDIESKLNYSSDNERSSFLVSLNQSYYTMSFDLPTSLDKLFAPSVTPEQLANYVGENNPATYISSVTYGRIFYMLVESSSSQTEMQLAVDGAFSGVTVDVDASLDVSYLNDLEDLTINVFAYGGEAGPTIDAIGETNLNKLKMHLKAGSTLGSARPLSYVVRNVADNQIVSTQLATQYDVVECEQISNVGTLPGIVHWTNHPLLDDFGPITAAYADNNEQFILVNEQGQWLRSTIDATGIGQLEGPFEMVGLPFSKVGATCRIQGPGESLYVFNELGNKYAVLNVNGNWSSVLDISEWFSGSIPFATAGVGAITYQGDSGFTNNHTHLMFEKLGQNHALGFWSMSFGDHYPYGVNSGLNFLGNKIDAVGAALGFVQGNSVVSIYFNQSGTEYVVHGDFGLGYETRGPFSL